LKLFLALIDIACVNAIVLWLLKYPNWQQKKNHSRPLYLLSFGYEKARAHKRRRAHSGNVNRRTCKAMRAMGVACKQPASPAAMRKDGRRQHGRCSVCPPDGTEEKIGIVASAWSGCARTNVSRQFK
jgi:hypothetical protein